MAILFDVVILGYTHCIVARGSSSPQHHLNSGNYSSFEGGLTFWSKGKGTPC